MRTIFFLALCIVACNATAQSQKPSAYPAQNQSTEQKSADDQACLAWAKTDTGLDPAAMSTPPAATGPQGERLAGAVRGATAGAIIGEVADDDSSHGAKVGATAGVLAGGRAARRNQAARQQQAQAAQAQSMDAYWRAWGACMSGKGYTVQ
jgi:hypothetical protein